MARSGDLRLLRTNAHSPSYFTLMRDYVSGEQSDLIDFCIPCNPYFPTPAMFERLQRNLETILKYYPSDADTITAELCNTLGLQPQTVAMGNGSTELITWIDHLLVRESLAVPIPTFGRWTDQPLETGKRVDMYPLLESQGFRLDVDSFVRFVRNRGSRVAVICNPNNPDGGFVARKDVVRMLDALHDLDLVVVDESFIDFVDAEPYRSVVEEAAIRPNVIVLKSLGKNFGLHGIRFGYMVANPALAGTIRKALPKWNLNSFAEVVVFMLKEYQEEYYNSLRLVARDRQLMYEQLSQLPGLTVYPSQGNFIMIKLPDGRDGVELRDFLLTQFGVYVRECGNKLGTTSQFLRLVVRPQPDVQRLLNGLFAFLYGMDTLKVPTAQAQQVSAGAQQQVGHGQKPSLTAGNPDAAWATGLAEITAPRQAAMAAMPGARPAGLSDPAVPAVASVGAQPLSAPVTTATGPLPQVTVSNVTEQNPLAVADTGVHAAITTGAGTAGAGAAAAGAAGADTGAFPVVQTGMIASVGAGGLASLAGGSAGSVAGGTAGTATLSQTAPGAGAPGGAGAGTPAAAPAAAPSTGSVIDTDALLPVVPTADITAPQAAITNTGPWPAVGGAGQPPAAQPPAAALTTQPVAQDTVPVGQTTQPVARTPAQPAEPAAPPEARSGASATPATDPAAAPSTTIAKRSGEAKVTETGSWQIPPDLASARARANAERGGKPRPTVADINARSGYSALGIDDRFALPPASRDSGPGTDWISIRRRKN